MCKSNIYICLYVFGNTKGMKESQRWPFIKRNLTLSIDMSQYIKRAMLIHQDDMAGRYGTGVVYCSIKMDRAIIAITEAKRENYEDGIAQNIIQLEAASKLNRKRKRDNRPYKIVTNAEIVVFLRVDEEQQLDEETPKYKNYLCDPPLDFHVYPSKDTLDLKLFKKQIRRIISHVIAIFQNVDKVNHPSIKKYKEVNSLSDV